MMVKLDSPSFWTENFSVHEREIPSEVFCHLLTVAKNWEIFMIDPAEFFFLRAHFFSVPPTQKGG